MDERMTLIDHLLCDDKLVELIAEDFSRRYPLSSKTGRKSTPVEVIFRMLALKHLRCLSYEKTIRNVKESLNYKGRKSHLSHEQREEVLSWLQTLVLLGTGRTGV
uniref:Transposase n=1 Tax=Heteroscytonema crispum UCFS10 TaxID=1885250 RepID=A0A3G2KSL8_9CYAN|nr:transposase [Heteroscytonema crispum UCFS10]